MQPAVAILIDVENMHRHLRDEQSFLDLLERIAEYGDVRYRRAYANWTNTQASALYSKMGCELIQTFHPASGKNTADIQIAVDAMDLLALHADIGCFVLATGDSDFSPLFRRLRERGRAVVGCGPRSLLSETVKYHCTYFILANTLRNSEPVKTAEAPHDFSPQEARKLLARALREQPGPVNASLIGEIMRKVEPSFDVRLLGFPSFRAFLEQHPDLAELHLQDGGAIYVTARNGMWKAKNGEGKAVEGKVVEGKAVEGKAVEGKAIVEKGFGESRAMDAGKTEAAGSDPAMPGPSPEALEGARSLLGRALAAQHGKEVNASLVGEHMRALEPDFDHKRLGYAKFIDFLAAHPDLLVIRAEPKGGNYVRGRG
ncbi:MAG TPA: NYN domain-containing protein [Myxococcota bacterium]|nr:NYN domain-containing protein [Myxococcota bacterium]